jgi:hypothetical protein
MIKALLILSDRLSRPESVRMMTGQIYIIKTRLEKDFLNKSAQERFADLIASRPNILKLIPVHKIAKYLGLHPGSLSRIRKSFNPRYRLGIS